ncbi:MAG: hypothetical protein EOP53_12665 [Sphingobacteriales bacterium]|nr:MAG: hypothetical protein EOP53_12665 [Sphingobacteriales bacterium]
MARFIYLKSNIVDKTEKPNWLASFIFNKFSAKTKTNLIRAALHSEDFKAIALELENDVFSTESGIKRAIEHTFKNQRNSSEKFAGWQLAFIDANGVKYYIPFSDIDLPIKRLAVFSRYLEFLNSGISPNELEQFLNNIESCIENVIQSGKFTGIAKIKVFTEQAREFLSHPIHIDLLFDVACTFYVREDEDPTEYNYDIHQEKLNQLKKDSMDGLHDFFYRTPLKELLDQYKVTEQVLKEYSMHWAQKKAENSKTMELLENL